MFKGIKILLQLSMQSYPLKLDFLKSTYTLDLLNTSWFFIIHSKTLKVGKNEEKVNFTKQTPTSHKRMT